jgi:hypothetical protein
MQPGFTLIKTARTNISLPPDLRPLSDPGWQLELQFLYTTFGGGRVSVHYCSHVWSKLLTRLMRRNDSVARRNDPPGGTDIAFSAMSAVRGFAPGKQGVVQKTGHCMCEAARHAAPLYRLSLKKMESQTSQTDVRATRDISSPARCSPCPLIFTATPLFSSIPIAPRPTRFRSLISFRDARQVKLA